MDEDVEAIFVLDDVTGDLKAAVLNVQTRRFNTLFEYNVAARLAHGQTQESALPHRQRRGQHSPECGGRANWPAR